MAAIHCCYRYGCVVVQMNLIFSKFDGNQEESHYYKLFKSGKIESLAR